ncbi:MAG: hypothetical protein OXU74_12065 [Gemmatimonadota bacterium]|nr:hypothetical protein [Gemmatimonadota bacterium]
MTQPTRADYHDAMDRLLACAVLFHGADTVADLATLDWTSLLEQSGLGNVAGEIEFTQSASALRSEIQIGQEFAGALQSLDERRQRIALKRTYARNPEKLAALGNEFGISRERARQLEVRLRHAVDLRVAGSVARAVGWLRGAVGSAARPEKFDRILDLLVGDAPPELRIAAEVAVMSAGGYERLDGVVGDERYRALIDDARRLAPGFANEAGVVDERALRAVVGGDETPEWDALVHNARLVRIGRSLVIRDTRRARVFVALQQLDRPCQRETIAEVTGLADGSSLSSLLSSDPLFVRFTKDRWGLAEWTDEPYEGVVEAIMKRISDGGGEVSVASLVAEIPDRFDVLPATVRNYIGTRKFRVVGEMVQVVDRPTTPVQRLSEARDVVWNREGSPVLHFTIGEHHLRGNSQKISGAVAQHLGVGLDESAKIPFVYPAGVDEASVIWRSYDPNGPEMGRLREALLECGLAPGDTAYVVLHPAGLSMLRDGMELVDTAP